MTLHWFRPPNGSSSDLGTLLEHLHPLGIRMRTWDAPHATYQCRDGELIKAIGAITVHTESGLINLWPYEDIVDRERLVLACCGQDAFERKPSGAAGWTYIRKGSKRWFGEILVAAHSDDEIAQMVATHGRNLYEEQAMMVRMPQTSR